jgi:hypothetical protein
LALRGLRIPVNVIYGGLEIIESIEIRIHQFLGAQPRAVFLQLMEKLDFFPVLKRARLGNARDLLVP